MKQEQAGPVRRHTAVEALQNIEFRHLRYFVALADAGSFTHAAEQIFITQPTLSQQIRRLEEIVGTPLLERQRDGLRLTPAGRVLLEAARSVLSLVDHELIRTRQADAGLGWLTDEPDTLPTPLDAMVIGEFEPEVWLSPPGMPRHGAAPSALTNWPTWPLSTARATSGPRRVTHGARSSRRSIRASSSPTRRSGTRCP